MYKPKYQVVVEYFHHLQRAFTADDIIKHCFPEIKRSEALEIIQYISSKKDRYDMRKSVLSKGGEPVDSIFIQEIFPVTKPISSLDVLVEVKANMSPLQKIALGLKK